MKKNRTVSAPFDGFYYKACIFEASLILVALVIGWIAGINPFEHFFFSERAIIIGVLATMPLFVSFLILSRLDLASCQRIRRLLLETLGPGLHGHHWADLFVLAAIAGVTEEVLFRGVIQPWFESSWSPFSALIGSNIIFGLVHAVTPLYAVLAALVGFYLGWFLDYGGQRSLLVPVIIHGLYDFLAFVVLMREYKLFVPSSDRNN